MLEMINEESEEVKQQMEQEEQERKKMEQINKAKAKLLQSGGSLGSHGSGIDRVPGMQGEFMENIITSQAQSIHHKGQGEVRVGEEATGGMKDLKDKYDNLRS